MQIHFQRTGGFAGMKLAGQVDLDDLDEETAEKIRRLLDEADFFELPEHLPSEQTARDQYNYTITVKDHKRKHSVSFCETPNEELSELANLLFRLVRRKAYRH